MNNRYDYINTLWTLELDYNTTPPPSPPSVDHRLKAFAYKKFKEDLLVSEVREHQKLAIQREAVSEIYQLIGFDSVFQAVWFQAVVALGQTDVKCRASILPILASVLVSVATIVGVYYKFCKIWKAKSGFNKDKLHSSVLERHIREFVSRGLGVDWDKIKASDPSSNLREIFTNELVKLNRTKLVLSIFLAFLSALFAWLLHAVMCNKYP